MIDNILFQYRMLCNSMQTFPENIFSLIECKEI